MIAPGFPEFAYHDRPAPNAPNVIKDVIDEESASYSCCSLLPVVEWGRPGIAGDSGGQDHERTSDSCRAIRDPQLGTGSAGSA